MVQVLTHLSDAVVNGEGDLATRDELGSGGTVEDPHQGFPRSKVVVESGHNPLTIGLGGGATPIMELAQTPHIAIQNFKSKQGSISCVGRGG